MGGGRWDTDVYASSAATRAATSTPDFEYTDSVLASKPRHEWVAHEALEPKDVDVRESRDSDEHPNSVPIAVMFDVTGSMAMVPRILQQKLPELMEKVLVAGTPDPQILFGCFADRRNKDVAPVQISQFESDIRMDEHLRNIVLSGGGGGTSEESYELVMYFFARHTALDSLEKRGRKGYLFLIGDEMPYPQVKASEVRDVFGDDLPQDIRTEDIVAVVLEKYHVVYVLPPGTSHQNDQRVIDRWIGLIGAQNVLRPKTVEEIAGTIADWVAASEKSQTAAAPTAAV